MNQSIVPTWEETLNYVGAIHADRPGAAAWLPIPDFPGCFASSRGFIAHIDKTTGRRKMLRSGRNTSGHMTVGLYRDGKLHKRYVHRMVLLAFVGEAPKGYVCCHSDDDPSNNSLENLRWDSYAANFADAIRNGRFNKFVESQQKHE